MARKLFLPAAPEKWHHNATAGGSSSSMDAYLWGYYEAGTYLIDVALSKGARDALFYPICFNYRHYVELSLKYLILEVERLARRMAEIGELRRIPAALGDHSREHSIERLLNTLEECLSWVSDEPLPEDARSMIIQLHNVDPDGQTFRYPTRRTGTSVLPDTREYDLNSLLQGMEEIHRCFLGIDGWLGYMEERVIEYISILEDEAPRLEDLVDTSEY